MNVAAKLRSRRHGQQHSEAFSPGGRTGPEPSIVLAERQVRRAPGAVEGIYGIAPFGNTRFRCHRGLPPCGREPDGRRAT